MNSDNIVAITIPFMFSWVAWIIFSTIRRYKLAKLQADVQTKLLGQVGSCQDLLTYAQTEADPETCDGLRLNESASRASYDPTATPLLRYLIGITRTPDLAEDVLQETYCRFLTVRLPDMDDRQTRNYLFRIATNLIHDWWRRGKDEPLPADSVEIPTPTPHYHRRLAVRQAFAPLNPPHLRRLRLPSSHG